MAKKCRINIDPKTGRSKVYTENGMKSQLYDNIISQPFINDEQSALELFTYAEIEKHNLSKERSDLHSNGEPKLFYKKSDGTFTESYRDALVNSNGLKLEAGYKLSDGGFVTAYKISPNQNSSTFEGAINNAIIEGVIEDKKVYNGNGEYGYMPNGSNDVERGLNYAGFISDLGAEFKDRFKTENGLVIPKKERKEYKELKGSKIKSKVDNKIGDINDVFKSKSELIAEDIMNKLPSSAKKQIEEKYNVERGTDAYKEAVAKEVENFVNGEEYVKGLNNVSEYIREASTYNTEYVREVSENEVALRKGNEWVVFDADTLMKDIESGKVKAGDYVGLSSFVVNYTNKKGLDVLYSKESADTSKILNDSEKSVLKNRMLTSLSKLGFSVMSMEEYSKKYKQRNGKELDVNAVADLTNRVIAIADGVDIESVMSEELAHVLTETFENQDEVRSILPLVEDTELWEEHSEKYFQLYDDGKIDRNVLREKVQREILGKMIGNKIIEISASEPTSLYGRIKNIISNFVDGIRGRLNPSSKNELERLVNTIAESVYNEELLDKQNNNALLDSNLGLFFNAVDNFDDLSKLLINSINSFKNNVNDKVYKFKSNELLNNLDDDLLQSSIMYLNTLEGYIGDIKLKLNHIDKVIEQGETPTAMINDLWYSNPRFVMSEMLPAIQELESIIRNLEVEGATHTTAKNVILQRVNDFVKDINNVSVELESFTQKTNDLFVNELNDKLPNMDLKNVIDEYSREVKDESSLFMRYFGNATHHNNIFINLLGKIVSDMYHVVNKATNMFFREYNSVLKDLGITDAERKEFEDSFIERDKNGRLTGYVKSAFNFSEADMEMERVQIEAYNKVLSIRHPDMKPIEKLSDITLSIDTFGKDLIKQYNDIVNEARERLYEQPVLRSYKEVQDLMRREIENGIEIEITDENGNTITETINNIDEKVFDQLRLWSFEKNDILNKYRKNGVVDYSEMSEVDKERLNRLKLDRKQTTSVIDPLTGDYKKREALTTAKQLIAINQYYINNFKKNGARPLSDEFYKTLENLDESEALDWFLENAGFRFNQNFWDTFQNAGVKTIDVVRQIVKHSDLSNQDSSELMMKVDELEHLMKRKNLLLRQYKSSKNPSEVDTSLMGESSKQSYFQLEERISELYSDLNSFYAQASGMMLPNLYPENTTNESFDRDFAEVKKTNPNITELEFAKNNMTFRNKNKLFNFENQVKIAIADGKPQLGLSFINNLRLGLGMSKNSTTQEVVNEFKQIMNNPDLVNDMLTRYAKTKVVSMYSRLAPAGYGNFINSLKNGNLTDANGNKIGIKDVVDSLTNPNSTVKLEGNLQNFLEINPENTWYDSTMIHDENGNLVSNVNEKYIKDGLNGGFLGGRHQPKSLNMEFINEFQLDVDHLYKTGQYRPKANHTLSSKKLKQLAYYNFLIESRAKGLEKQGYKGIGNAYTLPGIRRSDLDSYKDSLIGSLKETITDTFGNPNDKKVFGQSAGTQNERLANPDSLSIPVIGVHKLTDVENTSTDLLYSYTTFMKESFLHEERKKNLKYAKHLQSKVYKQKFSNGKTGKASNDYNFITEYANAYFYGVTQNSNFKIGGVDVTRTLKGMAKYFGWVNLGLNPAVSITAGTSASIFTLTEGLVGQYTTSKSLKKGMARFAKHQADFIAQTGDYDKDNEIYVLGERFNIYAANERVKNSYSTGLMKSVFKDGIYGAAHQLTDVLTKPFAPTLMYSVLDDLRYVKDKNGDLKFMSWSEFKKEFKGKTKSELETLWNSYEDNNILNNMEVVNGEIKYSDKLKDFWKELSDKGEEFSENAMESFVTSRLHILISKVDSRMPSFDKSYFSRNLFGSLVAQHREWFLVNVQNRIKKRHVNLMTGKYEEGSYRTLFNFIKKSIFSDKNLKSFRENWDNLSQEEQENLYRVLVDFAITAVVAAFGSLVVKQWVDDEENKDDLAVQYLGYLYMRMMSEHNSSTILGIPQTKEILEKPFVIMNSLGQFMDPDNYSLREVDRGPYKGHSRLAKLIMKNTFYRHYVDTTEGIQEKSNYFRYLNSWSLPFMNKENAKEKKLREKREALEAMGIDPDQFDI